MHPRERVRQLVELHTSKNEVIPDKLVEEAKRLGIELPNTQNHNHNHLEHPSKENTNGPTK